MCDAPVNSVKVPRILKHRNTQYVNIERPRARASDVHTSSRIRNFTTIPAPAFRMIGIRRAVTRRMHDARPRMHTRGAAR